MEATDETFIFIPRLRRSGQYKSDFNRNFWFQMAVDTLWQLKLQFILLNNELNRIFPSKVRIFSCSSDGQKSYCRRTFYQQIHFISQQFAWKDGRGNGQIWRQMPNMEKRFIAMLQSSRCISQTIFYCTQIDVPCILVCHSISFSPYFIILDKNNSVNISHPK